MRRRRDQATASETLRELRAEVETLRALEAMAAGAQTLTVTRNEVLYSLNKPDDFILAMVEFSEGGGERVRYLRRPFQNEPDFGVTSVNYDFSELWERGESPC